MSTGVWGFFIPPIHPHPAAKVTFICMTTLLTSIPGICCTYAPKSKNSSDPSLPLQSQIFSSPLLSSPSFSCSIYLALISFSKVRSLGRKQKQTRKEIAQRKIDRLDYIKFKPSLHKNHHWKNKIIISKRMNWRRRICNKQQAGDSDTLLLSKLFKLVREEEKFWLKPGSRICLGNSPKKCFRQITM